MTGLKFFSGLISHCKRAKVTDSITKTKKGLQSLAMDWITNLVNIYTADAVDDQPPQLDDMIMQTDEVYDHKSAAIVRDKEASSKNQ